MSMPITKNFSIDEFRCHSGDAYPPEWIAERLKPLCDVLEAIRAACGGRSVHILSGYRTADYNAALRDADGSGSGVAKNSQHIQGRAADIAIEATAPSDVHAAVMRLYNNGALPQLGGVGLYQRWVHVDVRPTDGHLAMWNGPGVTSAA